MSQEIASKIVKRRKSERDPLETERKTVALQGGPAKIKTADLALRLAGDALGRQRNYKFREADHHFPFEPALRTVDQYFPNAEGGPLLIDEPTDSVQLKACQRKEKVLRTLGYRYLILRKDSDEFEARQALQAVGR